MTTRRAIDVKDLDAATRAKLGIGHMPPGINRSERAKAQPPQPQRSKGTRQRNERTIAEKRVHTGRAFEADLAMTHQHYEFLKCGKLWPHAPPFVRVKGEWIPKAGGGPIDYTGHVVATRLDGVLRGCRPDVPGARVIPVAFDAKVGDAKSAIYHHEQKRQHQLHTLRDAGAAGVAAFLLVLMPQLDRPHGRLFIIDVAAHFVELLTDGVRLYEPPERGRGSAPRGEPFLLLPSIGVSASPRVATWDWIPLLGWLT